MNELIHIATEELARFLSSRLPDLSPVDWWQNHVVDRLSDQQQRKVREQNYTKPQQLDLAALLRVLDHNWHEFSDTLNLPREKRHWVKELQIVRNDWAHCPSDKVTGSADVHRAADTLGCLLAILKADQFALDAVESVKKAALTSICLTNKVSNQGTLVGEQSPISVLDEKYYRNFLKKYHPESLKLIFIFESPPSSGKYFYDENGETSEPLFAAMMKLLDSNPKDKREGLQCFQRAGYLLQDATYQQVDKLKGKERNNAILNNFDNMVKTLTGLCKGQAIPVVLAKMNVCDILEKPLKEKGFAVKNNGVRIPYPTYGENPNQFHEKVCKILQEST